jgi:hypothetical protein
VKRHWGRSARPGRGVTHQEQRRQVGQRIGRPWLLRMRTTVSALRWQEGQNEVESWLTSSAEVNSEAGSCGASQLFLVRGAATGSDTRRGLTWSRKAGQSGPYWFGRLFHKPVINRSIVSSAI